MADAQTSPTREPDHGKELLSWRFPEFQRYDRSGVWYAIMGAVGILALIWALWDRNFLFALIVLMGAAMLYAQSRRTPRELACTVYEDGIRVGETLHPYKNIKRFWIVYHPQENVKALYLDFNSALRPNLPIPLMDMNPVKVRSALLPYVKEDLGEEDEPTLDEISRLLKV